MNLILTLSKTTEGVGDGKENDKATTSTPISHASYKASKDHAGSESRDKENGNGMLRVAIGIVQRVDIRALQPITHCGQQVYRKVSFEQAAMPGFFLGIFSLFGILQLPSEALPEPARPECHEGVDEQGSAEEQRVVRHRDRRRRS